MIQQQFSRFQIITVGIAIFAMFFGAGNLVHPIAVGMNSGSQVLVGLLGFLVTTVCLPLAGLIAMILFDGNYEAFFARLGSPYAKRLAIFIAMLIIGPVIAIPRIVTLSHVMVAPFIPIPYLQAITLGSSTIFALIFLGITYLGAFRETGIISLLGNVIGPIKVISLGFIIIKGCLYATSTVTAASSMGGLATFKAGFLEGYGTLDLLGAVFFSSMTLHLLKVNTRGMNISRNALALIGLQASLIGAALLAVFYAGLTFLGYFYGAGVQVENSGELFRIIAFNVMGTGGAAIIAVAVLMACLSTSIALSAVFAEYLQKVWPRKPLRFDVALAITVFLCLPLSVCGLGYILQLTAGPIIRICYPVLIVLTFCNIAYKLFGFKPVQIPVLVTLVAAVLNYLR